MAAEMFTLNPSCTPDTWLLWVGMNRFGAAAIDTSSRLVKTIGYHSLDLYQPDQLRSAAAAAFGEQASIRKIMVAFRLDSWCWTPASAGNSPEVIEKWIHPFFPQRVGHSWIADSEGPNGAVGWVEVPGHLLAQLQALSPQVFFRHAAGFKHLSVADHACRLELTRVGDRGWFSIWQNGNFIYGQPHVVETEADLLYVLSMLSEKFDLPTAEMKLTLTGEWEADSEWLSVLRRYFSKIEGRDAGFVLQEIDQPGHWFTPLSDLLS